jgi:predicted nucleotidyltransferase
MKLTSALDPVFSNSTKVRLLRTMFAAPERAWTGREVASSALVSTAQTARDLHGLSDVGLVEYDVRGKSYSWHLNRDHVLFAQLSQLFGLESSLKSELIRQVAQELRTGPIERARMFGSVARGEERSDSDIDLFLQVRNGVSKVQVEAAITRARDRVWKSFGNALSSLVYTFAESKSPPNPALMNVIDRDGIEIDLGHRRRSGAD